MNPTLPENCRIERKFFISKLSRQRVEIILKSHHSILREAYSPRFVNNIYLDTHNFKCYFDNVDGAQNRMKYRIRWYGELFSKIANPVLEIKTKHGLLGGKISYPLKPFELKTNFSFNTVLKLIRDSDLPEPLRSQLQSLQVALINRYRRQYFISSSYPLRATLDYNQEFYKVSKQADLLRNKHIDDRNSIIELKYALDFQEQASLITQSFPFRMTKSSKYVRGLRTVKGLPD